MAAGTGDKEIAELLIWFSHRLGFIDGSSWPFEDEDLAKLQRIATALASVAAEREEAKEQAHYANGTADLAMKHRDEAEARADDLAGKLEKATGLLQPFADLANRWTDGWVDDDDMVNCEDDWDIAMKAVHFRNARDFLATLNPETKA